MKHLGDITKISGWSAPIVDTFIFGAPCQDLSVAGKRAGMKHTDMGDDETTRSGLYHEAIRIMKEMRERDARINGRTNQSVRPRYGVYENVPGAFSSNKGCDFQIVIQELIKVAEPKAPDVPVPEKGWPTSGCIVGDTWSVAWRVLDAQYWGVPQRRRRICVIADFNGHNAPKIVFGELEHNGSSKRASRDPSIGYLGEESRSEIQSVTEGLSGNPDESGTKGQTTAGYASDCFGADDRDGSVKAVAFDTYNMDVVGDKTVTLRAGAEHNYAPVFQPVSIENHPADSRVDIDESGKVQTLTSRMGTGGGNVTMVMETRTVCLEGNGSRPSHKGDGYSESDTMYTLNTVDRHAVVYGISPYHSNCMKSDNPHSGYYEADTARTLDALQCGYPGCNQGGMAVVQPVSAYNIGYRFSVPAEHIDMSPTLTARMGTGGNNVPAVTYQKVTGPLMANSHPGSYTGQDAFSDMLVAGPVAEPIVIDRAFFNQGQNAQYEPQVYTDGTVPTLVAKGPSAVQVRYIVRRLTPLECERLQGFPDGWTDIGEWIDSKGKKHKEADSPRYKALGNSIAIPPWKWVLKRLCACYERDATMASLFSGIGGFDLIWTQLNGWNSVLWEAEIEDFPSAVCKRHFGDEATGEKGDLYKFLYGGSDNG